MTSSALAIVFALLTSLFWGLIAPFVLRLGSASGGSLHPAVPFLWASAGNVLLSVIILAATDLAPLRNWTWHWSGFALFLWPLGGLLFVAALLIAPEQKAIINVIAASYPALVTPIVLFMWLGQTLLKMEIFGIIVATAGVMIALLARHI
ncbi:MAG: hypothetical protein A2934_04035 [Candidatus Sungbacteria bacterium RIFCSPLOWO2_01_FULL_47_10]|uniref:Uncharacterized protein n=1 Tax=Candidatus Sungbacteria bacterium RIFCSPLOWO2_01_FULL_47_10 TaxID=1802276 RepID=A0A1G2L325_9BACT|nr:MAG: hypothetical protein A2934_04035 [Candidatus Sungbacteria bacterium RIFCSPLOWO2_01_FULL_47_10]